MTLAQAHAESLLAFWAEAGIDAMLRDEPVDRIAAGQVLPPRPAERTPVEAIAPTAKKPGQDISQALETARLAANSAENLEGLAAAIEAFDLCPLKATAPRRQSVFFRGQPDAPVMVIGEAPSQTDARSGVPFSGDYGHLLDNMLAASGLTGRAFITNTLFWPTPGDRNPTIDETLMCLPFLERAIELVAPKFLLIMGTAAAKGLLGTDEDIKDINGRWFEWRSADRTQALPTLLIRHPRLLVEQAMAKRGAWENLQLLMERLDRPQRT